MSVKDCRACINALGGAVVMARHLLVRSLGPTSGADPAAFVATGASCHSRRTCMQLERCSVLPSVKARNFFFTPAHHFWQVYVHLPAPRKTPHWRLLPGRAPHSRIAFQVENLAREACAFWFHSVVNCSLSAVATRVIFMHAKLFAAQASLPLAVSYPPHTCTAPVRACSLQTRSSSCAYIGVTCITRPWAFTRGHRQLLRQIRSWLISTVICRQKPVLLQELRIYCILTAELFCGGGRCSDACLG